jgi:hypothetical protein
MTLITRESIRVEKVGHMSHNVGVNQVQYDTTTYDL